MVRTGRRRQRRTPSNRTIRVGVVGVGRGQSFMRQAGAAGMELVAICDTWKSKLDEVAASLKVTGYTDYAKMLEHDLDAVVTANFFHEHAGFAIQALRAGKHVLSETAACGTLAEGVALCREVERSGKVYMLAENYPFTKFNLEMKRLYEADAIGRVVYAEGEYNHPMDPRDGLAISRGWTHWRRWIPPTYYCTHALAPLMHVTGLTPLSITAMGMPVPEVTARRTRVADPGFVVLCQMNKHAVFRIFGLTVPGHSNWYRFHGTRGAMELERGHGYFGSGRVRLWHEPWQLRPGEVVEQVYHPQWPELGEMADKAGHGGGDFFTCHHFAQAIQHRTEPPMNVYQAVAMAAVGILGWRSALAGGQPQAIPDFRDEAARAALADDDATPFPTADAPAEVPSSVLGHRSMSAAAVAAARARWKELGYDPGPLPKYMTPRRR